ncbi:MAG: acyltransferase family protein [Christensenellales bacterium]
MERGRSDGQSRRKGRRGQQGRIAYVDAARGLAILCVVLGHLYPGTASCSHISSFHVPVFFILSGLLMAARTDGKPGV